MTDLDYVDMEKSTIVRSFKPSPLLPLVKAGHRVLSALAPALAARIAGRLFTTPPRARRPQAEIALLAAARARPMQIGARRIETWVWGAGPSVLLVHGWGGRGAQLGALVGPLVARGFSVVTFDAPGHGASDKGTVTDPGDHEHDSRRRRVARSARGDRRALGRSDRHGPGALGRPGRGRRRADGAGGRSGDPGTPLQRDVRVLARGERADAPPDRGACRPAVVSLRRGRAGARADSAASRGSRSRRRERSPGSTARRSRARGGAPSC